MEVPVDQRRTVTGQGSGPGLAYAGHPGKGMANLWWVACPSGRGKFEDRLRVVEGADDEQRRIK